MCDDIVSTAHRANLLPRYSCYSFNRLLLFFSFLSILYDITFTHFGGYKNFSLIGVITLAGMIYQFAFLYSAVAILNVSCNHAIATFPVYILRLTGDGISDAFIYSM